MEKPKKQGITTGDGHSKTPILARENAPMEGQSPQSQTSTSIAEGSTKPLSVSEALSLLQSICLDLRELQCPTSILTVNNAIYIRIKMPVSIEALAIKDGHIWLDGLPVSAG